MKPTVTTALITALSLVTCLADTKEDVQAAVQKLAEAPNYSWTAESEIANSQFTPPTINGMAEKDGYAVVKQERDGNTTMAVLKGDKGVVKTDEGWQTAEDLRSSGGGQGRGGFRYMGLLRSRAPAAEAERVLKYVKDLKSGDGVISGDLTTEGAKELMSFGRGGGGRFAEPTNTKGSVKFWLKDGQLAKMQLHLSGTYSFNGNDRDIDRITTVEISKVGMTKVEVPADAKKKLGA